jgi:hypothetical protein
MSTRTVLGSTNKHVMPVEELKLQPIRQETQTATAASTIVNAETGLTKKNLLKVIAVSVSFFFAGNNDGSLGALTPYILHISKPELNRQPRYHHHFQVTFRVPSLALLFFMLGTGISAGGWVAEYLIQARNGHLPDVGYVPARRGLCASQRLGRYLSRSCTAR